MHEHHLESPHSKVFGGGGSGGGGEGHFLTQQDFSESDHNELPPGPSNFPSLLGVKATQQQWWRGQRSCQKQEAVFEGCEQ